MSHTLNAQQPPDDFRVLGLTIDQIATMQMHAQKEGQMPYVNIAANLLIENRPIYSQLNAALAKLAVYEEATK